MDLFDAAVASGQALLVPVKLDLRELRAAAAAGEDVPHLLRGLVRVGRQAGAGGVRPATAGWPAGWPGSAAAEQEALLLDLVRGQAAVVLGHTGSGGVRGARWRSRTPGSTR